jgi:hypothetical protein
VLEIGANLAQAATGWRITNHFVLGLDLLALAAFRLVVVNGWRFVLARPERCDLRHVPSCPELTDATISSDCRHYKAASTAKGYFPKYLQMTAAAEDAGFTIGYGRERTISAVTGLQAIYNQSGEDGVRLGLHAIASAWPDEKAAVSSPILCALADILGEARANGGITSAKLAGSLAKTTPSRILRKAEEFRFDLGGSKRMNVRRALKALAKI